MAGKPGNAGNRRHGHASGAGHNSRRHPLYTRWVQLRQKCRNPNSHKFKDYGGRKTPRCPDGIYFDTVWDDFARFLADVGEPPGGRYDLYSLDRIDNDGPYAPDNVRWATAAQQRQNQYREPWPFGVLSGQKDGADGYDWEAAAAERERLDHRYPESEVHPDLRGPSIAAG